MSNLPIHELFAKDVARPIDGVIKADDDRNLLIELEEYVPTRDVLRGLADLTDRYVNETSANGVWISGFFGSGKSHLLKILSLVLDRRVVADGQRPADIILPKIEDELLRADLRKAAAIPAESILFNVDQKFDGIGGDHSAPILEVFVKVLNELQGYYGNQGYIAEFEHRLAEHSDLEGFKATYLRINGTTWEKGRQSVATVTRAAFARAYAGHFGVSEAEALGVMQTARDEYRVSIESFARRVKQYIDSKGPNFRLNFFVDEIGQFIGQDQQRMLNLQTVAETLSTVCRGRAWVFVTSQADLEAILGDMKTMKAQDITKIKGRFKTQLTLASADVQEVIQKRLLAKKEAEPEVLTDLYDREKDNLSTLFRFSDGSAQWKSWRGSDEFCSLYPFHPYQMELFQRAIISLSSHDAFTGKFLSVGERSMLAVFQEVAKAIRFLQVGRLAGFDLMYDGIAPSIRGDMQTSMKLAERHVTPEAMRILKALFLLKWLREFKATGRNIAVLLLDSVVVDIAAHEKAVQRALAELEGQSFLQRNGEIYEFLTDKEKDIEKEIKATEVDDAEVTGELGKLLFADLLREPKIRSDANGQDYPYVRRIDDAAYGRETAEIGINIITTENPNYHNAGILAAHNVGKAELLVVLPADEKLVAETRLYLKTKSFVMRNSADSDKARAAIVAQRTEQNAARLADIGKLAAASLGAAPVYLNGAQVEGLPQSDARVRLTKAGQLLIAFAYPNSKMVPGNHDEASLTAAFTAQDGQLFGGDRALTEAESEVFSYLSRAHDRAERVSADDLVKHFAKRPYGWSPMAALTQVARLFRMARVELRTSDLLSGREAADAVKNAVQRQNVRITLQQQFDAAKVNALKRFCQDFFDKPNTGTDARAVGQWTQAQLAEEAKQLAELARQAPAYAFLEPLTGLAEKIKALSQKDHSYLLNHLPEFSEGLLAAKDETTAPIKSFMNGQQRQAYDEVQGFLRSQEANLAELSQPEVQPLRDLAASVTPYRGTVLPTAKAALVQVKAQLDLALSAERDKALAKLAEYQGRIEASSDWPKLTADQHTKVLAPTEVARAKVAATKVLTGIRDVVRVYGERDYPEQLSLACQLAAPPPPPVSRPPQSDKTGGDKIGGDLPPRPVDPPRPPRIVHVPLHKLKVDFQAPTIGDERELDSYLQALRGAIAAELRKGNRVTV